MSMRLDKFISETTSYSRRDAEKFVHFRRVSVNGKPAEKRDMKVDEFHDEVILDGAKLLYRKYVYLMLNKPAGYLSATEDEHDPVVLDLVPAEYRHFNLFPVGRLDKDTEGLLLLTNDGQFDHKLTSPRKNLYKRYYAELDKPAEEKDKTTFRAGMVFQDFTAKEAFLEITDAPAKVYIEIAEGKFHQVKRMCEKIGKSVLYLKRTAIGALQLDPALEPGKMRELSAEELALF